MKTIRRLLSVMAFGCMAMVLTVGAARGADLTHSATTTLNLGTGAVSYDNVRIGSAAGSSALTIVDATGTSSFTSSGTQLFVGAGPTGVNTMTGTLKLGISSSITANQITIGGLEPDTNGNAGHAGLVTTLVNSITTINVANMALGTGKGNGTQIGGQTGGRITLGSGATLNLYGFAGSGSRANLVLGRMSVGNAARGYGVMDLSSGTATLVLSELGLGKVTASNGLDTGTPITGTLTLSADASNHLDIVGAGSVVKIGYRNTVESTVVGTLTIGNLDSTSSIVSTDNSTAILIGNKPGTSNSVTGTLNFNGGTLTITTTGSAIAGGGGTSTLNLSNCTLIAGASSSTWIQNLSTATLANTVTFNTGNYDITIPQGFSGTGGLTKTGAGTLTITGVNAYAGATAIQAGQLRLSGVGSVNSSSGIEVNGATAELMVSGTTAVTKPVTVTQGRLRGTGAVNGNVALGAAGTLAAGDAAIGTLQFGGTLTLHAAGSVEARINKSGATLTADKIAMTAAAGSIQYLGTLTVTASGDALAAGETFTLFAKGASGSFSGSFATMNLPALGVGLSWDTSGLTLNGTIQVVGAGMVAVPVFTLPAGGYLGAQSVGISCTTEGAEIHYTTDGSTPTAASPVYVDPIPVPADTVMTIKALAIKDGLDDSAVVGATYSTTSVATWVNDANGSWPVSGNWLYGVVGGGIGLPVRFDAVALSGDRTVTFDSAVTVGSLTFGDAGDQYTWTVNPGVGGTLTFDAAVPTITVVNRTTTLGLAPASANGLTKAGAGTLKLGVASTYSGSTTIDAGTLRLGASNVIPDGSGKGSVVVNGTLDLGGFSDTINGLSGGSAGRIDNTSGTGTYTLTLGNNNAGGTFAGTILPSSGTLSLIKAGTGTQNLNGVAALGSVTVGTPATDGGSLVVGVGGSLSVGSGPGSALYVVAPGADNGAGTLDASASAGFVVNVGTLGVADKGQSTGTGRLVLSANTTITATTKVSVADGYGNAVGLNGTISNSAIGTTAIHTPSLTVGRTKTNVGSFTFGHGATLTLDGIGGGRAQVVLGEQDATLGSDRIAQGTMDLSDAIADLKLSRLVVGRSTPVASGSNASLGTMTLSDSAANRLDIVGSGSVVLLGYSAGLPATGTLAIGNLDPTSVIESTDGSTAILIGYKGGSGAATGTLTLNGGTLTLTTTGTAIAGGGGASALNLNGVTLKAGASSAAWIQGLNTALLQSGGVTLDTAGYDITVPQAFSGSGGLTKTGDGTLTLATGSVYSGPTVVQQGALRATNGTGSATGTGAVTVKSGATLEGTGRIGGAVTVETGGRLSPGAGGAGLLTVDSLVVGENGVLAWDIDPSGADDAIDVVTALTVSAPLTLNISLAVPGSIDGTVLFNMLGGTTYTGPNMISLSAAGVAGPLKGVREGTQIVIRQISQGSLFTVR